MARIILTTFGSFGDLHPYLALAIALRARGHETLIATSEIYREKITGEGIEFGPMRPNVGEWAEDPKIVKRLWDARRGTEYLLRDYVIPQVEQAFNDLRSLADGADLLISHAAVYATPIVAELLQLPWLSVALQPSIFMSAYDPPVLAAVPWFHNLRKLGHRPFAWLFKQAKRRVAIWTEPIQELRVKVGLPRSEANPLFEGTLSPYGTLLLFSKHFAQPQPDWTEPYYRTGFVFYDHEAASQRTDEALSQFIDRGDAPVVFTLGSSAVFHPGTFFRESEKAVQRLGVRAVFLTGLRNHSSVQDGDQIYRAPYAPYSQLFKHASLIVHQGGIGTTAQALVAGKPMLVVPWAHDQPDNAARLERLGVARVLKRTQYGSHRVARELSRLITNPNYAKNAAAIANQVAAEDGLTAACDQIEATLAR